MAVSAAERTLIQRCLNQDTGAWREFVDRYLGLIYHVIHTTAHLRGRSLNAEDTEDLAADILVQIVARDFAVLRAFKGNCSLAAYLTVIARRCCLHELGNRSSGKDGPLKTSTPLTHHDTEGLTGGEQDLDSTEEVQRLLTKLPPRERQVVRMFYIEGRTYDEISTELNVPRNSIGPILSRARSQLRQNSASS